MNSTLAETLVQSDVKVRLTALKAALDANDREAPSVILGAFANEANPKVRAAMLLVVGRLGTRDAVPALAKLTAHADPDVRCRSLEALVAIGDPSSFPPLVRSLSLDEDPRVRDLAANHLVKLGRDGLLELLGNMLKADRTWMRESAVTAAGMFNTPLVVPLLAQALGSSEGGLVSRAKAGLERLASLGNDAAWDALGAATKPPAVSDPAADDGVPVAAARTVPTSDAPSAEPRLPPKARLSFDDTYVGARMERVEMEPSQFEDAPPDPAPPPAAPQSTVPGPSPRPLSAAPYAAAGAYDQMVAAGGPALVGSPALQNAPVARDRPVPAQGAPMPVPVRAAPLRRTAASGGEGLADGAGFAAANTKPCPVCGEEIAVLAKKCRFCNEVFDASGLKALATVEGPGECPTALKLYTGLGIVSSGLIGCGGLAALLLGKPGILIFGMCAVAAGIIYSMNMSLRRGSSGVWWFFMVGSVLNLLSGGTSNIGSALLTIAVLSIPEVRRYCIR